MNSISRHFSSRDVKTLGQVFTPAKIVKKMLRLCKNDGRTLEPSSGDGAFLSRLGKDAVGIEIDGGLVDDPRVLKTDFFSYPEKNKFDTIIGNPPYVRFQDIKKETREILPDKLFDARSNLYLFFIDKCIGHLEDKGEMTLITPRDFLKATSSRRLNERLYREGSITHYYELGDKAIFKGAQPNCAIWRWEKGRTERQTETGGRFCCKDGQIWFGDETSGRLGDHFEVKVGAVSGADDIFVNAKGCTDMVCSTTAKDGKPRRVIYGRNDKILRRHKKRLLARRIRKFNEANWWEWGRKFCERVGWRIYVNSKTRNKRPFFASDIKAYDGSVLALFPRDSGMDAQESAEKLNGEDWERLGFVCDGRYLFTQKSLENAPVSL